ncbi:MAG: phosphomannomutase/phosphoglucomutase, partial [Clostridia bacterium]|nr:phosphomannomutase/phosphoglucomutase [Clostridia bacterium]
MPNYDFTKLQNGSDIRGVALEGVEGQTVNLTETAVERLSLGFLYWLSNMTDKKPSDLTIAIGHDPRLSGEAIAEAFTKAVSTKGAQILD